MDPLTMRPTLYTLTELVLETFEAEDQRRPTLAFARRARAYRCDRTRQSEGIPTIFDRF